MKYRTRNEEHNTQYKRPDSWGVLLWGTPYCTVSKPSRQPDVWDEAAIYKILINNSSIKYWLIKSDKAYIRLDQVRGSYLIAKRLLYLTIIPRARMGS